MSPAFSAITKAMNSTLTAIRNIKGAELGPEFAQAAADVKLAENAINSMNEDLGKTPQSTQNAGNGFSIMKGVAVQAITAIASAGKDMLGDFISFGDEMTSISARMTYLTGGAEAAADANEQIYYAAQRARTEYDDMAKSVNTLYGLAGEEFGSIEAVTAFSETMSKAFAATGTGAMQQKSAMQQLTQAITSGVLAGDELRSIRENAPMLAQGIEQYAQSIYGTTLSLKEMGAQGMLTSQIVIAATLGMTAEVDAALAAMPMTASQTANEISNSFKFAFSDMAMGFNQWVSGAMQQGMTWLIDNFDAVANVAIITGVILIGVAAGFGIAWAIANWPIVLIIGSIILLGAMLAQFGVSAGDILFEVGALFGFLYAIIYNGIAIVWNTIAVFVEFLANVFVDPVGSIQRLFIGVFDSILGIIETVAGAIGALFGSDQLANDIAGFRSQMQAFADSTYGAGTIKIDRMQTQSVTGTSLATANAFKSAGDSISSGINALKDVTSAGYNAGAFDPSMVSSTPGGKALNVKNTEPVKIDGEDIKMLLDISTMKYQVHYQQLTPQIALNIDTVRESADMNQVMEVVTDWVSEAAESRLVYG